MTKWHKTAIGYNRLSETHSSLF